ncbi:NAD-dependent epimerase/dehydratase family protein [Pseudalkalibacillus salsuginis]|uniref:NAD-dependent epimerase/dehydratase family protein n=1 Tax=Pseudalkalibacillus salsuginis TaxID=2910972 RepID=UPI001F469F11|nr:NAD-dependent epimerase/dehydratase family protein [Pseudalkalibacillus salsuginis]MCF6410127.1 NAD-dependent epimerase/dehydratase family protein [Pseudalkalibacillus salsuginis]
MKVLITGGAGFIGTYTKDLLKEKGHQVLIVDNLSTGNESNIDDDDTFYKGDIQDLSDLKGIDDIDVVIHLAAQIQVPVSVQDPLFDMDQNIGGTIKVVEFAKKANVKKVIFASSAAVYGDNDQLPIKEESILEPMSPYGISKMAAEKYVEVLCQLYGIDYVILRYANVFGAKQTAKGEGGVIKIFYDLLAEGKTPLIEGNGNQTRDFIYVEDIARAHLYALDTPSGIYNLSTNTEITINELCRYMIVAMGKNTQPEHIDARKGDIYRSCLDNSKFIDASGWAPAYSVEAGINSMINELEHKGVNKS